MEATRLTLTIAEAAAALGVSERHLYQLARDGRLPGALRLGNRWLIPRRALERLLGQDEQPIEAPPVAR
jgi:excisionase family DNA binding protein